MTTEKNRVITYDVSCFVQFSFLKLYLTYKIILLLGPVSKPFEEKTILQKMNHGTDRIELENRIKTLEVNMNLLK